MARFKKILNVFCILKYKNLCPSNVCKSYAQIKLGEVHFVKFKFLTHTAIHRFILVIKGLPTFLISNVNLNKTPEKLGFH